MSFQFDSKKVRELWTTERSNSDIAAELGLSLLQLYAAGRKLKLRNRSVYVNRVYERSVDPTPEQIAERAAAIRAEWPEGEAERRLVGNVAAPRWTIPAFTFDRRRHYIREQ